MNAKKLLKTLEGFTSSQTIHMYIIERKVKPESKPYDKPSLRFEYIPIQINLSKDLSPIVAEMLAKTIERKVREDVEIKEYEVIDDTEAKLYTYRDTGKIAGFYDFLKNRLAKNEIKTLKNFEDLKEIEKAWAVCYGFYNDKNDEWLYCIKKLQPRKIAIEDSSATSIGDAIKNGISSVFDLSTKTLKPLKGFSINIEPSIDMIYFNELIYVLNKKSFEDVTSLTEEFENYAQQIVGEIEELKFIDKLEHLSSLVASKPSFRNKLIKAKTIGNLDFLMNCTDTKKEFIRTGKKLKITFQFDKSGKIIADDKSAENIINVLCEYFKEGIFGGKIFESPAGRIRP